MLQPDVGQLTGREFGGTPGLGVGADGGDQRPRGAGHDGGPGEHHAATVGKLHARGRLGLLFDGQRLTGERGLVDLEVFFLDQASVGGHYLVGAHLDHVAGPQLRRFDVDVAVGGDFAGRRNLQGQQLVQPALGAQPLAGGQHGVAGEHRADQHRVDR